MDRRWLVQYSLLWALGSPLCLVTPPALSSKTCAGGVLIAALRDPDKPDHFPASASRASSAFGGETSGIPEHSLSIDGFFMGNPHG